MRSSSSGTRSCGRWRRPATRPHTTPTSSPTGAAGRKSPGSSSPATRSSSATSAARTCMRAAIRSRPREELYASIERLLELPDHVLVYPSHYGGSVCGRGLSGNPVLEHRFRAPPQLGARSTRMRRASPKHCSSICRPLPRTSARSSTRIAAGSSRRGHERGDDPARASRERRSVRASRRPERLRRRHGRARAEHAPARRRARLRPRLEERDPQLRRRLRDRQGALEPRRRRARRPRRAQAPAGHRLAARSARAAPDRARAQLGLDRRREPLPRRQPGPRLVDDRRDEDRPRRPAAPWARARV